jgi:formate hydrogenlyase subunit 3/multisubunit Na+/H+ antiporter MnhD subunit
VNGPILTLLAVIVASLLLLGALGAALRRRAREAIGFGSAGLSGLGAILALLALVLGEEPAQLSLPLGLPGAAFHLVLDPLSGFFALLVFAAGTAVIGYAAEADPPGSPNSLASMPVALGGLALAALAGDGFAFAPGIAIAGGAIWATGRAEDPGQALPALLWVTLLAAASVLAAAALLGGAGLPLDVPAAPQTPLALLALLLGLVPLACLAPLHSWLTPVQVRAPVRVVAMLIGAAVPLAFEALVRLVFAAPDHPLPAWFGLPPLALGAASLLMGGVQASRGETLDACLAAGTVRQSGIMALALGIALTARGQDQPAVAAEALGALLLAAVTQAVCGTLAALAGGAIRRGAATQHLSRLGGLIHGMPATTTCLLAALFGLAALPPGLGFATLWLVFQALLAEVQSSAPAFQAVFVAAAWMLGLSAALGTVSLVRLVGVACLGRPRTARTSAAEELPRPARVPLLCLAGASIVLGVFVGPVLRWLAEPAIRQMLGTGLGERIGWLGITATPSNPGYAAVPVACLLVLAGSTAWWLRRRLRIEASHTGPAWDGGFAAPPAWLPFGDPKTQSSGVGFTPLPEIRLPRRLPSRPIRWPRLRPQAAPAVAIAVLAIMLLLIRWLPS